MGTIARQTIKGSVYSYVGAALGFVNVVLLMPHIFSTAQVGLVNLIIAISSIMGQFGMLGFANVTKRLFPFFRNPNKNHNGFLFILLMVALLGFFISGLGYFALKDYFVTQNKEDSPLFAKYVYLLLPLIFIYIFTGLIDVYNRVLFNASFGIFVKEFFLRILNLIGIGLYYYGFFDFNGFIHYYTIAYGAPVFMTVGLLIYRKQFSLKPDFSFLTKKMRYEMVMVAVFALLSGFSSIAAMYIDKYMINHYFDLSATGVYAIAFYFGSMIILPGRALVKISTTYITESFKSGDWDTIKSIYSKSALNQLIMAAFVFLLLWGNIDSLLAFLPEAYHEGKYVILYIALAYLSIMGFGLGSEIIVFSKYYRHYAVIMILLIVFIIFFNLLLIPSYGIVGAAMASLISYFFYCFINFLFILIKFGFHPFTYKHPVVLLIGFLVYLVTLLLSPSVPVIVSVIIKSLAITVLFLVPVYVFNISEDLNKAIHGIIRKIRSR